jgi:hypothetical protein
MHVFWLPWTKSTHHQELVHFTFDFNIFNRAKMYTKIDLCGTYNLVRNWKSDEWKTTIKTR